MNTIWREGILSSIDEWFKTSKSIQDLQDDIKNIINEKNDILTLDIGKEIENLIEYITEDLKLKIINKILETALDKMTNEKKKAFKKKWNKTNSSFCSIYIFKFCYFCYIRFCWMVKRKFPSNLENNRCKL